MCSKMPKKSLLTLDYIIDYYRNGLYLEDSNADDGEYFKELFDNLCEYVYINKDRSRCYDDVYARDKLSYEQVEMIEFIIRMPLEDIKNNIFIIQLGEQQCTKSTGLFESIFS